MIDDYDRTTAKHYVAYRPPLHKTILEKCLARSHDFSMGLDIGCGTGHSSIALSNFCEKVIAIDPSEDMVENAIKHSNVEYGVFDGSNLNFEPDNFNITTFAGSLFYAKSQKLFDEVVRVTKNNGLVVVYDFEMQLAEILNELGFESTGNLAYYHEADFSGLHANSIALVKESSQIDRIEIDPTNLAHLLLSVKEQHQFLEKELGKQLLHQKLTERLLELFDSSNFTVGANIFFKVFTVIK